MTIKRHHTSIRYVLLLLTICTHAHAAWYDLLPSRMISAATRFACAAKAHAPAWMFQIRVPQVIAATSAAVISTAGYFGRKRLGALGTYVWTSLFRKQAAQAGAVAPLPPEAPLSPEQIAEMHKRKQISDNYVAGPIIPVGEHAFLIGTAGEKIAVGTGNQVDVYSSLTGKRLKCIFSGYPIRPNLTAVSDKYLVTVTRQNSVQVRTITDGNVIKEYAPRENQPVIGQVAVAGDHVAASFPNGVRLWGVTDGSEKEIATPKHHRMLLSKNALYIDNTDMRHLEGRLYDIDLKSIGSRPYAGHISTMSDKIFAHRWDKNTVHIWPLLVPDGTTVRIERCSALAASDFHWAAVHGRNKNNISIFDLEQPVAHIKLPHPGLTARSIAMTPAKNVAVRCYTEDYANIIRLWQQRDWHEDHQKPLAFLTGQHQRCGAHSAISRLTPDTIQLIARLALTNGTEE